MIPLKKIIQHIVETFQIVIVQDYDEQRLINRVDFLSVSSHFDCNTLYLCADISLLKKAAFTKRLPDHPEELLLLTDVTQPLPLHVIRMSRAPEAETLYDCINEYIKFESLLALHVNKIFHALYYGRGLTDVVKQAENYLHHPISICDASYAMIETSPMMKKISYGMDRAENRFFLSSDEVASLKRLQIEDRIYETNNAFFSRTEDHPDNNWIFCAIRIQNVMAGYVAVCLEADIEATEYELRLTTALADICAIEMQKHDFFVTRSGLKYENFLIDLLEGNFKDVNLISSRLELLDRKFCQFFCLVVLNCFEPHDSQLFNKRQMTNLRRLYPNSMSVVYKDNIVLFINQDAPVSICPEFTDPIEEFAARNHMKAGISQPFRDIMKINSFYQQAVNAISLGDASAPGQTLYFSGDLLVQYLCHENHRTGLEVGIHYHLFQLHDYDEANHTEFITTLRAYLTHDRNATQAAEALHIHRSTFFYRIKKIEDLLDISITDSHLLFLYELSFQIWEYLIH